MPLDHEELCVEPALVHVSVVRPAERGAPKGTRLASAVAGLSQGTVQLYELMLPVIFALNLFGERLAWPRWRKVRTQRARAAGCRARSSAHVFLVAMLHRWDPSRCGRFPVFLACGASLVTCISRHRR